MLGSLPRRMELPFEKQLEAHVATTPLTLELLTQAVAGGASAIRAVTTLQPAGGQGDKVFPPTYATDGRESKYALEKRRIGEREVQTVLLDSVASQANRMEEGLLQAWRDELIAIPVVLVDFSGESGLEDLEQITSLQAPHRLADALLRDSLLDGELFRDSGPGKAFTAASVRDAGALFRYCPTALVFGMWDSTGPKGGLGSKFERAITSEIVGIDVITGVKVGSRIDPAQIEKVQVYESSEEGEGWTVDEGRAVMDKKKPKLYARVGEKAGKPSEINHGNVTPTVDTQAGGVTMSYAQQTTVLSMAALRRLRFPVDNQGDRLDGRERRDAELAVRTTLAALAIMGVVAMREQDYDLRSRCVLIPQAPLELELLSRDGGEPVKHSLGFEQAADLLRAASEAASAHGYGWDEAPIEMVPAPKLAQLIRRSRGLALHQEAEG